MPLFLAEQLYYNCGQLLRVKSTTFVLFNEYIQWEPRTKLELIDGQLILDKSMTHSQRLLSQILRGWGLEAAIRCAACGRFGS